MRPHGVLGGAYSVVNFYRILAGAALATHFIWILWVIFGALLTRGRPFWRWFHILSLIYGILIEVLLWPCPLTIAEQWLQARDGRTPYQEGFLIHYLDLLVYPDVSETLLTGCASAVCLFNLGIYVFRFRRRQVAGW